MFFLCPDAQVLCPPTPKSSTELVISSVDELFFVYSDVRWPNPLMCDRAITIIQALYQTRHYALKYWKSNYDIM